MIPGNGSFVLWMDDWKLTGSFILMSTPSFCSYKRGCFSFLIFSMFLQCLFTSQSNSIKRAEDTIFLSFQLLGFTSEFYLPCVAFISGNHGRKLGAGSVDKSWLILQAWSPVPEKPGLAPIHCHVAETEMAPSLIWYRFNWKNEFLPLTEARKELSPYTYLLCHLWLGNGCTVNTGCRETSMAALKHYVWLCMHSLEVWPHLTFKGSCIFGFCREPDEVKSGN